ncbi:MAG: hypothetical protein A2669_02040 [Candidatus Yanofskybacteria bacterium RIFCSPHIGHO2_01_FULL_48_25b]|nr:MAG: hypothetical protein A2669_02040 [Candidatus Yanofskybacteria bacterium RIFCSPHIGHO2_01_FULL_48_25b]
MELFKILKKDKQTKARLGVLNTRHGKVYTPAYVFVATYGRFRHLRPADIKKTKTQLVIANTFHLWNSAPVHHSEPHKNPAGFFALPTEIPAKARNLLRDGLPASGRSSDGHSPRFFKETLQGQSLLTNKLGVKIPTMTDSGGFQVLSLAFGDKNQISRIGKFIRDDAKLSADFKRSKIRVTNKGVYFSYKDEKSFLGPELSMKIQKDIGADIVFAFDHITSPLDDYEYNKKALGLTSEWAEICLKNKAPEQKLYGIVQGGIFKDLRKLSAKQIGAMPFDGFGIGGSYTKKQISKILKWVVPRLPDEKPRHLLGVGKVADIFEAVENGIDTFDCVIPTREARHGRLYTRAGHMDIRKGIYAKDRKPIEKACGCPVCKRLVSRSKIRELLKSDKPDKNAAGQRHCLIHNMWFFNNLLEEIRTALSRGSYFRYKNKVLKYWV